MYNIYLRCEKMSYKFTQELVFFTVLEDCLLIAVDVFHCL